ncbi:uncharacterized protein [Clytia hemisphaerica]|uniref:Coiled-coil protein 142 C-terminal domain-containing protein n=1 Tax=Clytia hemisphaerica TaxID=252671 RepID=A0A7M5V5Z9_9CNID
MGEDTKIRQNGNHILDAKGTMIEQGVKRFPSTDKKLGNGIIFNNNGVSKIEQLGVEIKTCNIHRMNSKRDSIVYWSNGCSFARVPSKEATLFRTLPRLVKLRRHKLCLTLSKGTLDLVHCIQTTFLVLEKVFRSVEEFDTLKSTGQEIEVRHIHNELQNASQSLHTVLKSFKQTIKSINQDEYFEQLSVSIQHVIMPEHLMMSCSRLRKHFRDILLRIIEIQIENNNVNTDSLTKSISYCSLAIKQIIDFESVLSFFATANNSSYPLKSITKSTDVIDVCFYITKLAEGRSRVAARKLVSATLDSIKIYLTDIEGNRALMLNQFSLNSEKFKPIVRILKRFYRKILEKENEFYEQILNRIHQTNMDILQKNTDVLYPNGKRKHTNDPRRIIHFDHTIGPNQKEYLFTIYMDTLWKRIKTRLSFDYVIHIFEDSSLPFRVANRTLVFFELELLRQIRLKLESNGSSPQTFLETLTILAAAMVDLWSHRMVSKQLSSSMGLLIKDRFRRVDNEVECPSSQTFVELLKCQSCIQEQLNFFTQYGIKSRDDQPSNQWINTAFQRFHVLNDFTRWMLLYKRNQFLASSTWEQYFVLSTSDIKYLLFNFRKVALVWNNVFDESSHELLSVNDHLLLLEEFENESLRLMIQKIGQKSRGAWRDHLINKKVWKRKGTKGNVYQASACVNVVMQMVFGPLIENLYILSVDTKVDLLCKSISIFIKSWMDHILNECFIFSRFGAQQLSFDFSHFLTWFEQEEMGLSLDTITEIHTLPTVNQMKSAIMLLACQPDGRKGYRSTEDGNLLANYHGGSSSSTISQVSIESYAGAQFEDVIKEIELHDKDRWLALRAKGGQAKRLLCLS